MITAVTMGALTQVRVLGGTIGLAIWYETFPIILTTSPLDIPLTSITSSTILNNYARSKLGDVVTMSQLVDISNSLTTIETLTAEQQAAVRMTFAEGYNKQMRIMTVFSGVAVLTTLLFWEKRPRRVE